MSIRRHEAYERFIEYFTEEHEPPLSRDQAISLSVEVGHHALMCVESAEWFARILRGYNEEAQAQIDHDQTFIQGRFEETL